MQTLDVPKDGITVPVTASADWGAGAYAVVTLYRPLGDGGKLNPVRAMGLAWIGINPAAHKLTVTVQAPCQNHAAPDAHRADQDRRHRRRAQPYVTLSAVDEGILQLTRFTTPDPLGYFYGKLALGEDIRDDYGNLLDGECRCSAPSTRAAMPATFGGPGLPVESTKVVSLFSGRVQVGADGMAQISRAGAGFRGPVAADGRRL